MSAAARAALYVRVSTDSHRCASFGKSPSGVAVMWWRSTEMRASQAPRGRNSRPGAHARGPQADSLFFLKAQLKPLTNNPLASAASLIAGASSI